MGGVCLNDALFTTFGRYDIIVSGGGTSGIAAAIAAARRGKRVLVLENQGFFGGMATGGMISQFMGFADGVTSENVSGVMGDILRRLWKVGAASKIETIYLLHRKDLGVKAAAYDSEALKTALDDLALEAGVETLFHTKAIATECNGDSIDALLIHNNDGIQRVTAKVYIDATFHGSITVDAGCGWVKGDENGVLQPGSLMFRLSGVDLKRFDELSYDEKTALGKKGVAEGRLCTSAILCRPVYDSLTYCNMSRVQVDATLPADLSRAEMEGRRQINRILPFLKENVPGFEKAVLAGTGVYLGLRDSRRIRGLHTLTADEILNSVQFDDNIAVSSYPIDIHDARGSDSVIRKPEKGNYFIPYRCMVGRAKNLVFTGRCISADHAAHAAIRVMATCIQLGEAAGLAAAMSVDTNTPPALLDGSTVRKIIFSK